MGVLGEILEWSKTRPEWQRDALRRLVATGDPQDDDYEALTAICKSSRGLEEKQDVTPLSKEHIPAESDENGVVNLLDIAHHEGVNALAQNQKITFGAGLTIVYGDNAARKSGYTRILKGACQARGFEEILGNVLSCKGTIFRRAYPGTFWQIRKPGGRQPDTPNGGIKNISAEFFTC